MHRYRSFIPDTAYQAKAAGRNTVRFFDPAIQALAAARTEMENDLRIGVAQNEFILHYQIQVDNSGDITGVEALVRWNHSTDKAAVWRSGNSRPARLFGEHRLQGFSGILFWSAVSGQFVECCVTKQSRRKFMTQQDGRLTENREGELKNE